MAECVQIPTWSADPARVVPSPMEARAITHQRVSLVIVVEADVCAVALLEKCLQRPGPVLWLRHWLGEAISYVVRLSTGYKFNFLVRSGVIRRVADDRAC